MTTRSAGDQGIGTLPAPRKRRRADAGDAPPQGMVQTPPASPVRPHAPLSRNAKAMAQATLDSYTYEDASPEPEHDVIFVADAGEDACQYPGRERLATALSVIPLAGYTSESFGKASARTRSVAVLRATAMVTFRRQSPFYAPASRPCQRAQGK